MDYKELAKQFIEDGAWDGVPAIAVRLFAQWLEEHEAAEQGLHPTVVPSATIQALYTLGVLPAHENSTPPHNSG